MLLVTVKVRDEMQVSFILFTLLKVKSDTMNERETTKVHEST